VTYRGGRVGPVEAAGVFSWTTSNAQPATEEHTYDDKDQDLKPRTAFAEQSAQDMHTARRVQVGATPVPTTARTLYVTGVHLLMVFY
jgi:hypothetical protein